MKKTEIGAPAEGVQAIAGPKAPGPQSEIEETQACPAAEGAEGAPAGRGPQDSATKPPSTVGASGAKEWEPGREAAANEAAETSVAETSAAETSEAASETGAGQGAAEVVAAGSGAEEVARLVAEAEERGYLRGRNERIESLMAEPSLFQQPEPQRRETASEILILNNMRRSVWD